MRTSVVVLVVGAIVVLAFLMWTMTRQSVPDRLARTDAAGTGHGTEAATYANTGRPGDAATEDMVPVAGDAVPGPPPADRPPARPAPPVDPDSPGRSVDDTESDEAVEPNEPA